MIDLSLVIPVYNERESIESTLREIQERLESQGDALRYELIVVDDGSTDGTGRVLESWPGIERVTNESNRGYGAALKAGIRRAKGEIIGITDADGTYPNRMIPDLFKRMRAEEADMVVAARTLGKVKIPLARRPAKMVLNLLANYLTGRRIPDLNSGLRLFRRELALKYFHLISDGFSFTTTITLAMLVNDYAVVFEPIEYAARAGRSKIRPLRDTFNFLILILRTIAFFHPLKIFIPLSLTVFLLAVACLAYQITTGNVGDLSVILLLSSLQIFLIGILADLISRKN
jgi:glycosyltransferase involved in cell wall biosynthesis